MYRLFDLFNLQVGTTQILGATRFTAQQGRRVVQSVADGVGVAASDKTHHWMRATLEGQDIAAFGALIGLFETAESLSVSGEGKVVGDANQAARMTANHMKLVRASLRFLAGQHAQTTFELVNSCDANSVVSADELAFTELPTKTLTVASGYRGVRIVQDVEFTPNLGSPITCTGVTGLELDVRWPADVMAGDSDYGEVVETGRPNQLSGALLLSDVTLGSGATLGQRLQDASWGTLVVPYEQQAGQGDKVLTLVNVVFEGDEIGLAAAKHHSNRLPFSCFLANGVDTYTIGSGVKKIISVA